MLISGYIFQEIAYAYIRIYFRRLHMLISGYISGDCICLYKDIFQEIAYAYTGYISGDCICLYRIYFMTLHMLIYAYTGYISGNCICLYQDTF